MQVGSQRNTIHGGGIAGVNRVCGEYDCWVAGIGHVLATLFALDTGGMVRIYSGRSSASYVPPPPPSPQPQSQLVMK